MSFINDEQVIGKWEFFTNLSADVDVCENDKTEYNGVGFKEIYFLPNGEKYWIFEGWTKGKIFVHYGGDEPILEYRYQIKEYMQNNYLYIDMPDEKIICILKKISDKSYKLNEIGNRDNIDIPFIEDSKIVGEWKSVGYVNKISEYTGEYSDDLWLKGIKFYKNGNVDRFYDDEIWSDKWTKNYLLDKKKSVKCKYVIKVIEGQEIMFLEWKMGNYVYGGANPTYYAFERI